MQIKKQLAETNDEVQEVLECVKAIEDDSYSNDSDSYYDTCVRMDYDDLMRCYDDSKLDN